MTTFKNVWSYAWGDDYPARLFQWAFFTFLIFLGCYYGG